jgi:hypothetical protein
VTARRAAASLAVLLLAWAAWEGAGRLVAACGLPFAALVQQAAVFVLALTVVERMPARLAPAGDSHG